MQVEQVEQKNATTPVIVYSKTYCPYCSQVCYVPAERGWGWRTNQGRLPLFCNPHKATRTTPNAYPPHVLQVKTLFKDIGVQSTVIELDNLGKPLVVRISGSVHGFHRDRFLRQSSTWTVKTAWNGRQ